jgi:4-aminobutyrate aminotransferase
MIGIELESHDLSEAVAQLCFRRGLLVLECGKKAIRISPPLILTEAQAAVTVEVFAKALADARAAAAG